MRIKRHGSLFAPEFEALDAETVEVVPGLSLTLPAGFRGYTGALGIRLPLIFAGQARMTLWHDYVVSQNVWGPCAFSDALAMRILEEEGAWLITRLAVWLVIFPFGVWRAGSRSARRTAAEVQQILRRAPKPRTRPARQRNQRKDHR